MRRKIDQCECDFLNYRRLTELEVRANEAVIAKQSANLQQMLTEMKVIKTMLEIPRFREHLPKYNFKGMNFDTFKKTFGQIYKEVNHDFSVVDKQIIAEDQSEHISGMSL